MLDQLSLILVTLVVLVIPATLSALTVRPRPETRRRHTELRIVKVRLVIIAGGIGVVALGIGLLLGGELFSSAIGAVAVIASVLAWLPLCRIWAGRGVVAWALAIDTGVAYLVYVLTWTATTGLSWAALLASLALWLLEAFVFAIGLSYVWEILDIVTRRVWPSYADPRARRDPGYRPYVSLHVPTHNEPPDLVIATLQRLLEQDYDYYEIVVVDTNTIDPALWRPVEAFCTQHWRIKFFHLEDWPGNKSGALNYAMEHTDLRAEVIGIVDADYLVQPSFLADCTPMFSDPAISFVQTPQDYRGWEDAPYFRRLYYAYGYFFDVSQRSRNERNGPVFRGTMSLIRRAELNSLGRWDEWCLTEDAELSLRLLRSGAVGVQVERSYGYGVMPLTFEALKRQRFRWCFGGIQMLRMHWRSLLPGRQTERNRLTRGQRWGYIVGGLQWFGDLASVLFTGFLLVAALDAVAGQGLVVTRLSGLIVLCVVVLLLLGSLRALATVRRTSTATWGEAVGAMGLWLGLGWSVAQAAARGLFARRGVFLPTPEVRGELDARHAIRGNGTEALFALGCTTVGALALTEQTPGAVVIGGLLIVQAAGFAAAPLNSLAAIRSHLPEELYRHRRLALASWSTPTRQGGRVLGAAIAAAVGLVTVAAPLAAPELEHLDLGRGADIGRSGPDDSDPSRRPNVRPSPGSDAPTRDAPTRPDRQKATESPTQRPTAAPTSSPNPTATASQSTTPPSEPPTTGPSKQHPTHPPHPHGQTDPPGSGNGH